MLKRVVIMLILALFGVFRRSAAKFFLETFAHVAGRAESYLFCYVCHVHPPLSDEVGGSPQTNAPDEQARRFVY